MLIRSLRGGGRGLGSEWSDSGGSVSGKAIACSQLAGTRADEVLECSFY